MRFRQRNVSFAGFRRATLFRFLLRRFGYTGPREGLLQVKMSHTGAGVVGDCARELQIIHLPCGLFVALHSFPLPFSHLCFNRPLRCIQKSGLIIQPHIYIYYAGCRPLCSAGVSHTQSLFLLNSLPPLGGFSHLPPSGDLLGTRPGGIRRTKLGKKYNRGVCVAR